MSSAPSGGGVVIPFLPDMSAVNSALANLRANPPTIGVTVAPAIGNAATFGAPGGGAFAPNPVLQNLNPSHQPWLLQPWQTSQSIRSLGNAGEGGGNIGPAVNQFAVAVQQFTAAVGRIGTGRGGSAFAAGGDDEEGGGGGGGRGGGNSLGRLGRLGRFGRLLTGGALAYAAIELGQDVYDEGIKQRALSRSGSDPIAIAEERIRYRDKLYADLPVVGPLSQRLNESRVGRLFTGVTGITESINELASGDFRNKEEQEIDIEKAKATRESQRAAISRNVRTNSIIAQARATDRQAAVLGLAPGFDRQEQSIRNATLGVFDQSAISVYEAQKQLDQFRREHPGIIPGTAAAIEERTKIRDVEVAQGRADITNRSAQGKEVAELRELQRTKTREQFEINTELSVQGGGLASLAAAARGEIGISTRLSFQQGLAESLASAQKRDRDNLERGIISNFGGLKGEENSLRSTGYDENIRFEISQRRFGIDATRALLNNDPFEAQRIRLRGERSAALRDADPLSRPSIETSFDEQDALLGKQRRDSIGTDLIRIQSETGRLRIQNNIAVDPATRANNAGIYDLKVRTLQEERSAILSGRNIELSSIGERAVEQARQLTVRKLDDISAEQVDPTRTQLNGPASEDLSASLQKLADLADTLKNIPSTLEEITKALHQLGIGQ